MVFATKQSALEEAQRLTQTLKLLNFKGWILPCPGEDRVEVLAAARTRKGRVLHLTLHPRGVEREWLQGNLADWWHAIKNSDL
jgi:hypothetical protein